MGSSSVRRSLPLWGLLLAACGGSSHGARATDDGTMLSPYLAIGDTLAADQLDRLPELGAQLIVAAQSRAGQPGIDAIVQAAGRIGARDIQTSRTAFKKMSGGMIEYLQANPDRREGHSIIHCTMTFGGEGALWVQRTGKVSNPYEGAMMLRCGDKLGWDEALPET